MDGRAREARVEGASLGGDFDDSSGTWAGEKSLVLRACGQLTGQDGGARELMPQAQLSPVWNGHCG